MAPTALPPVPAEKRVDVQTTTKQIMKDSPQEQRQPLPTKTEMQVEIVLFLIILFFVLLFIIVVITT